MKAKIWSCPAGSFQGTQENGMIQIRGIRYAVSERFGRPEQYRYPEGVHVMKDPAPYAVQIRSDVEGFLNHAVYESMPQEESCQYLSMTLPAGTQAGDRLPVMVWIHGGAYRNGGCDAPCYDRRLLVRDGGVLVVALGYRLSLLGFMKDRNGQPANLGILDLIEGLRWIRENIAAFGGDPENVTMFGQSAGADAARCIMLSEGTEDLWKRAILHSDPIGTMKGREKMERRMLAELNAMPDDADLEEVRRVQASITKNVHERDLPRFMIFGPHYGVEPIPAETEHKKRLKKVMHDHELMAGCTSREGAAYIGNNRLLMGLERFPLTGPVVETVVRALSRDIFNGPSEKFAADAAKAGGRVWYFDFHWMEGKDPLGACHMSDLVPLFGGEELEGTPIMMGMTAAEADRAGEEMRRIWTDFARTGTVTEDGVDGMLNIRKL